MGEGSVDDIRTGAEEPDQRLHHRSGLTRRDALKRGAIGGALLWTVPTLQTIGATRASADAPSSPPPPTSPPPPPPPPVGCGAPSHGILVYSLGGVTYAAKVDSGGVDRPGSGERTWLTSLYPGIQFPGTATGGVSGDHLSLSVPAGGTFITAFAADGNFGDLAPGLTEISPAGTPAGLEYVEVGAVGGTANFYKGYDCAVD